MVLLPTLLAARRGSGTMKALTPAGLTRARQVSPLTPLCLPDIPTPTTRAAQRSLLSVASAPPAASGLRHERAGSPPLHAESGSSSYGLPVHLRLLPTPPHGDAVTFNYGAHDWLRHGLPPCKQSVLTERTRPRASGDPDRHLLGVFKNRDALQEFLK